MRRFISIKDFGDTYGPKRTLTYHMISTGELHAVKIGPRTMIDAESAEAWAASLPRFKSTAAPARATEAA